MKDKKVLILIIGLIIVMGIGALVLTGNLFSIVPQEREIGKEVITASSTFRSDCPSEYNGIQVDYCRIEKISGDIREPTHVGWKGYTKSTWFIDSSQEACNNRNFYKTTPCIAVGMEHSDFSGEYWLGNWGYSGTLRGYKVYYEKLIKCDDGTYNYRSLCTPPCSDGQEKKFACEDTTIITTEKCVNNKWVKTSENCPSKLNYWAVVENKCVFVNDFLNSHENTYQTEEDCQKNNITNNVLPFVVLGGFGIVAVFSLFLMFRRK